MLELNLHLERKNRLLTQENQRLNKKIKDLEKSRQKMIIDWERDTENFLKQIKNLQDKNMK